MTATEIDLLCLLDFWRKRQVTYYSRPKDLHYAWTPVASRKANEWTQTAIHCWTSNKACEFCPTGKLAKLSWGTGCNMPHAVQWLIDRNKSLRKKDLQACQVDLQQLFLMRG